MTPWLFDSFEVNFPRARRRTVANYYQRLRRYGVVAKKIVFACKTCAMENGVLDGAALKKGVLSATAELPQSCHCHKKHKKSLFS